MKRTGSGLGAAASAMVAMALMTGAMTGTAGAQQVTANGGIAPLEAMAYGSPGGTATPVTPTTPMPTAGKQESLTLLSANLPTPTQSVYGGDYIFNQTCGAYGTVALQVLGPDGTSYQTLLSRTVSDAAGGTGLALGGNAQVRATAIGTSACYASLTRVP